MVSTRSGETVGWLKGNGCVVGLRVTADGNAYAWNTEGKVTGWNLATGKVVLRLDPRGNPSFNVPVRPFAIDYRQGAMRRSERRWRCEF